MRLTLPRNIADNADYENCVFVVLDYSSSDDLARFIRGEMAEHLVTGKLVYYFHSGEPIFRMAHAKNMAHRCGMLENADILVNLDADNYTTPSFASYVARQFTANPLGFLWSRMIKGQFRRGISGRMAYTTQAFLKVGGYDEKYSDWGPDDKNCNQRLQLAGYVPLEIEPRYLDAVSHNDKMRFREYPHAATDSYFDVRIEDLKTCIANYGNFGCGVIYRNFSSSAIILSTLPTRIFGIGSHKTATTSLHLAMQILGFDSNHWQTAHWAKAIWREMKNLGRSQTLERNYHLCDLPIQLFFRELDQAYPNSKFILTTLDEETWVQAARIHWSSKNKFRAAWDSDGFSHRVHQQVYGRKDFDRETFLATYRRHNQEVREYFKDRPQDLLEMPMSAGGSSHWPALCKFVGKPVPSVEYPHANHY